MRRHIEHLKQQHPAVRSRFALLAATGITAAVALIWVTTLPIRIGGAGISSSDIQNTASAISSFGDTVSPAVSQLKDSFSTVPTNVEGLEIAPNPTSDTAPAEEESADATDATEDAVLGTYPSEENVGLPSEPTGY